MAENDNTAMLLDSLQAEFVRVLRDPTHLAGHAGWESAPAAPGVPSPSPEEMSRHAGDDASLGAILRPREFIEALFDDHDVQLEEGWLAARSAEDVLRLFAPELARNARPPLPSLTRREHHAMSLDSAMQLGAVRPADEEPQG